MVKQLFTKSMVRIYFCLLLFTPLISFAQPRYNVVKDYGFENNDTIWVEYESLKGLVANRHVKPGYESQYSGETSTYVGLGAPFDVSYYCYLEQKLTKRAAKDYNLDKNLKYYFWLYPANAPYAYDYWYISFSSQKKELIFLYAGSNAGQVPKEDNTTHIVEMDIPKNSFWVPETSNFYEKWTEKFSANDTIEKIMLVSYVYSGVTRPLGQNIWWDDIIFESTRPDSDAAVVNVSFSGSPSANVQNKGTVAVSFPTICDIFKGGSRVYSDTVNVDSLSVDSIKQVSFKPYSDTGEMKIYTALPGDQNPNNDTLSKNLGIQEVAVKKPVEFRVWPVLTRGIINVSSPNPVRIYNINGREIASGECGLKKFNLTPVGIYFVKSGGATRKIIKIE